MSVATLLEAVYFAMRSTVFQPHFLVEQAPGTRRAGHKTFALCCLLALSATRQFAATPATQPMVVTVVNEHFVPARPVTDVRVTLSYFDGSEKITDARERTNRDGQTELRVSPEAQERGDLRIEVSDAEGLVVYKPSEGLVTGITPALKVVLLPKGSPALLEPAQIEAMLNRLSRLSVQNQRLKVSIGKLESQKPDFDEAIRSWSVANGLPYEEVNEHVQSWAADVLAHRKESSLTKQAEAELGLRHFENAAILFQGAANTSKEALHKEEEGYLDRRRKELRTLFQESSQAATAFQLAHQFDKATGMVDALANEASVEHKHYPDDEVLKDIWLTGSLLAELARWKQGLAGLAENVPIATAMQLFTRVVKDCRELLPQIDKSRQPDIWAWTESTVAAALLHQGEISGSRDAVAFREQAIAAMQSVVDTYDRKSDPKEWASFESLLGLTKMAQAVRGFTDAGFSTDQASALLAQGVADLSATLQVYSRAETPKEWANSQMELAAAFDLLGTMAMAKGGKSTDFFAQAVAGYKSALEVFTKKEFPSEWAEAEYTMGLTLTQQVEVAPDAQAHELLGQAVAAERAALELRNRQDEPMGWADTQGSLALALEGEAERTSDSYAAAELLMQSISAYQAEMEVITRAGFPQRWAKIQVSLGDALAKEGRLITGAQSGEFLAQAVAAYNDALQILTKEEYPQRWADVQITLGYVLASQGERATGSQSIGLFNQAVEADRHALEVIPRTAVMHQWANTQMNLGEVLFAEARVDEKHTGDLLAESLSAYNAALEEYTNEANPREWSAARSDIGNVLTIQGRLASGKQSDEYFTQAATNYEAALQADPKNSDVLGSISTLYHEYITDFPKAYEFASRSETQDPTDDNRLNLAEAELTTSRFSDCVSLSNSTSEAKMRDNLLPARQVLLMACEFGAGQQKTASQTAESLARYMDGMPKGGWTTAGDRKYLTEAPEFQLGRPLWIGVFQALQESDGPSLAKAARGLRDLIGN